MKRVFALLTAALLIIGMFALCLTGCSDSDLEDSPAQGGGNPFLNTSWENGTWLNAVDFASVAAIHFVTEYDGAEAEKTWKFDGLDCYFNNGIVYVVTGETCKVTGSMNGAFANLVNLVEITGLDRLDTSEVEDMSNLFKGCVKLETLDIQQLETENVLYAESMFEDCESLSELDMSGMDMQRAIDMDNIFADCASLNVLELPNTRDVIYLSGAFSNIGQRSNYATDVRGALDTAMCQDMSYMFSCANMYNYELAQNFDTKSLVSAEGMFYQCGIMEIDLSLWDTKNLETTKNMFYNNRGVFCDCNVSGWNVQSLKNCENMFYRCDNLTELTLNWTNVNSVANVAGMFHYCIGLRTLDITCFNGLHFEDASRMFMYCDYITTIYCDGFTADVSEDMFLDCVDLVGAVKYSKDSIGAEMANLNGYFSSKN